MIRPPTINLARRPFRNNTVHYAVFASCFALLLAASSYNVYEFFQRGSDLARLEQDLADRTAAYMALHDDVERMKSAIASVNLSTLDTKSSFANGLIMSRLFSWSVLFDRFEDLTPPEVRIRSIRPSISPKGIEITLDGLARTPEALYEFESNLGGSEFFSGVYPVSENTRETRNELNFDLVLNYVPSGKSGAAAGLPDTPTAGLPAAAPEDEGAQQAAGAGGTPDGTAGAAGGETAAAVESGEDEDDEADEGDAGPAAAPATALMTAPAPAATAPAAGAPARPPVQAQPDPATAAGTETPPIAPGAGIASSMPAGLPAGGKPLPEMTNKEFIDTLGQDRFMRLRGRFKPNAPGRDSDLTNQEFIEKHGMEEFLKERGALDRSTQGAAGGGARAGSKGGGR